jgi:stage V sporulation protein G
MNIKAEIKRLFPDRTDNLKAAASLVLDGCFVIKNVRVIQGDNGLFMSLPARRNVNGEFKEICFPTTKELRTAMSDTVLRAYAEAVEAATVEDEAPSSAD